MIGEEDGVGNQNLEALHGREVDVEAGLEIDGFGLADFRVVVYDEYDGEQGDEDDAADLFVLLGPDVEVLLVLG